MNSNLMPVPSCFAPPDAIARPLLASDPSGWPALRRSLAPAQARFAEEAGFTAQPGSLLLLPGEGGEIALAIAGVESAERCQALAALPFQLPEGDYRLAGGADPDRAVLAWGLGAYRFERYRKAPRMPARLAIDPDAHRPVLRELAATAWVRDLVNLPAEDLGPRELADVARDLASRHGATFREWAGEELLAAGFPTIHAVGRASARAPRLIELLAGDPSAPELVLIGKGVCFDSGGLDLKPADGMRWMKKDMGGAAHALALARLIMEEALPVHLRLLIPAVDNMVDGRAFKPGDVIRTRAGLTVEIDNTDAEGRLILCDAIAYAGERPYDLCLVFATLTGAARIALGPELPALYTEDEALAAAILSASRETEDPCWRMPLWRPYLEYLESPIADLANAGGGKMAGSVVAALFLARFLRPDRPFAHFDLYAWNDKDRPGRPRGGEAQCLRALAAVLRRRYRAP